MSRLDQELPGSRHPGFKKLFRRREDSHGGSACAFQICLGVDRAQERGRLGSRKPWFYMLAATKIRVLMA